MTENEKLLLLILANNLKMSAQIRFGIDSAKYASFVAFGRWLYSEEHYRWCVQAALDNHARALILDFVERYG